MENRCIWCNKKDNSLKEIVVTASNRFGSKPREKIFFVHPEHEITFRAFNQYSEKFNKLFLVLIGIALLAMILLQIVLVAVNQNLGIIGVGVAVIFLGILVIVFPFSTPETVMLFGLKSAIKLVRVVGLVAVGLGGWVVTLAF